MAHRLYLSRFTQLAKLFMGLGLAAFGDTRQVLDRMRKKLGAADPRMGDERCDRILDEADLLPVPPMLYLAIRAGQSMGGPIGMIAAGAFLLPAALLSLTMALLADHFDDVRQVSAAISALAPAMLALVGAHLYKSCRQLLGTPPFLHIAIAGAVASMAITAPMVALLITALGGAIYLYSFKRRDRSAISNSSRPVAGISLAWLLNPASAHAATTTPLTLAATTTTLLPTTIWTMIWILLQAGSLLLGSGYLLLVFLRADLVGADFMTIGQLLSSFAIAHLAPGPMSIAAVPVGYHLHGVPGGLLAAIAISLPTALFALFAPAILPLIRSRPWVICLVQALHAAAVGVIAVGLLLMLRDLLIPPGDKFIFVWRDLLMLLGCCAAIIGLKWPAWAVILISLPMGLLLRGL